ncbi:unnamed protein product [Gongylonema pulchrum]|uniref:START domain-containing protein n=1 Tax=Gongylonema pulchrum TaxID=637853 RepID=A0A183DWF7_9BILA|nr:unnamed protein product [Gongylonema pulchrum]
MMELDSCTDTISLWQQTDPDWRKYSLDVLPKVLLGRGDMVKLLCDSGVAKYCEFKCVDRFLSASGSTNPISLKGLIAVCQFLESVGRYSDSPFLWTLYGSGELPQCFCRLCAVFGGTYCLDRQIEGFIISDNRVVAVVTQGQRIDCRYVIASHAYTPQKYIKNLSKKRFNRAVLISEGSILPDPEKEHVRFLALYFPLLACNSADRTENWRLQNRGLFGV